MTVAATAERVPILADSERTLPRKWSVTLPGPNGRIDDVEAICVGVRAECLRRWPAMSAVSHEDWLEYLLEKAVDQIQKYNPAKRNGTGSAEGYLYDRLRFRMRDGWRTRNGRNGHKAGKEFLTDKFGSDALGLLDPHSDVEDGWAVDRGGLYAVGDRRDPRAVDSLGGSTRAGTTGRAAQPTQGTRGGCGGGTRGEAGGGAYWRDCECGIRHFRQAPNGQPGWHWAPFCPCGRALT